MFLKSTHKKKKNWPCKSWRLMYHREMPWDKCTILSLKISEVWCMIILIKGKPAQIGYKGKKKKKTKKLFKFAKVTMPNLADSRWPNIRNNISPCLWNSSAHSSFRIQFQEGLQNTKLKYLLTNKYYQVQIGLKPWIHVNSQLYTC